jgi:hypothetical protein
MRRSRAAGLMAGVLLSLVSARSARAHWRAQAGEKTYFEFQVTKPVRQAPGSATPTYPVILKSQGIQGEVLASFVVDTFGRAEPASFKVLHASHEFFAAAVRSKLPEMRFIPAEVLGVKVRQLVQQPFVFAIQGTAPGGAARSTRPDLQLPTGARDLRSALGTAKPAPSPPIGTVDGWTYVQNITVDSGGSDHKRVSSMRLQAATDKLRIEIHSESFRPELGPFVELFDLAAHTTTIVFPQRRAATVMGPFSAGTIPLPFRVEIVGTPKVNVQNLGEGEAILGHRTQKNRVSTSFVLRVTIGGQTCSRTTNIAADEWTTTDVDIHPTLQEISSHLQEMLSMPGDAFEKIAALRANRARGLQLRSVSKQTRPPGPGGTPRSVTTTMQVTELAHGSIERAAFAIPEGYMTTEARERLARLRATEDSRGLPHPNAAIFGAPADSMLRRFTERFCDPPPKKP